MADMKCSLQMLWARALHPVHCLAEAEPVGGNLLASPAWSSDDKPASQMQISRRLCSRLASQLSLPAASPPAEVQDLQPTLSPNSKCLTALQAARAAGLSMCGPQDRPSLLQDSMRRPSLDRAPGPPQALQQTAKRLPVRAATSLDLDGARTADLRDQTGQPQCHQPAW